MTKYEKDRCELCEGPLNEDNTHIMEMPDATWLIHKGCAMRLFKGVWDEQVLRSTIPIGESDRLQKGNDLLISHPENAPMGFVWFSEEDELTEPDVYASDLIAGKPLVHKTLMKKGTGPIDTSALIPGDVIEVDGQMYAAGWQMGLYPFELSEQQREYMEEHSK